MISKNEIIELIEEAEESPTLDYKEDLHLETDGDKAEFVKDVIALANSGELAHIIVGVEDGTGRPVGLKTTHDAEQLNQILKDKCDPPISVEYIEKNILGYKIGVIEFSGEDPPYIVSVSDKFGGQLSANPDRPFFIQRGTVFIRNYNMNAGAKRADLDKIYKKIKYVTLQADLRLGHEVAVKSSDDVREADIKFILINEGDVLATDIYVWVQFKNIKEIVRCTGKWTNISSLNNNIPTVQLVFGIPVIPPVRIHCDGAVVRVDSTVESIEARVIMGATNMRAKEGPYFIPLKEKEQS